MLINKFTKLSFLVTLLAGFSAHGQDVPVQTLTSLSDEFLRNSDLFRRTHSGKSFVIRGLLSSYTTFTAEGKEQVIVVVAPSRELKLYFSLVCPLSNLADRNYLDKLNVGLDDVVLSGNFAKDLSTKSLYATLGFGTTLDGVGCRVRN